MISKMKLEFGYQKYGIQRDLTFKPYFRQLDMSMGHLFVFLTGIITLGALSFCFVTSFGERLLQDGSLSIKNFVKLIFDTAKVKTKIKKE